MRLQQFLSLTGTFLFFPLFTFTQNVSLDSIINSNHIREIVEYLASDSMKGRCTGTPETRRVAEYIAAAFQKAGAKPVDGNDGYFMKFDHVDFQRNNLVGYNIVAALPGKSRKEESIIFSAHYDHVGTTAEYARFMHVHPKPGGRDTIYNGANDNASGVAALISLARYYGARNDNERTIVFIAFSGEEMGLVGSRIMAEGVKQPGLITCMINFDMVGKGGRPFITGSEYGDLRAIMNGSLRSAAPETFKKNYFAPDRNIESNLFIRSDNWPFALLNIPAHTIMTTNDDDPFYHTVNDETRTLNYTLIQRVVRAVAVGVMPIINGTSTPARIKVARFN